MYDIDVHLHPSRCIGVGTMGLQGLVPPLLSDSYILMHYTLLLKPLPIELPVVKSSSYTFALLSLYCSLSLSLSLTQKHFSSILDQLAYSSTL